MSSYAIKKTPGDTTWFRHDRFGMFIHWGLYALPARHEWVKTREKISEEKYQKYFEHFDPDLYDPEEWARQAKAAGMKYVVMTAKHHEGFCMFDSKYTDYKCTNTPAGRDLIREYTDAFRKAGLRVGFYYSLIDWHHPDFTIDTIHPRKLDSNVAELNQGRDMKRYAEYMRNQVEELLTNYGQIDLLWFDFSYDNWNPAPDDQSWMKGKGKDDWESEKLLALIRKLQPNIIINNRTGIDQDLVTPEQYQPLEWIQDQKTGEYLTWEACQTFSGSWGYYRDEQTWKSPQMLIELLINSVARGGNLLMNIGPTSRGYIDYRAEAALKVYADWMKYNSRSIYGCTMAEPDFKEPRGCRFTQSEDGKRLYIHLMEYPFQNLLLPDMADKIEYAQFLHDGSEILFDEKTSSHFSEGRTESDDLVAFRIPPVAPNVIDPVIEVILK